MKDKYNLFHPISVLGYIITILGNIILINKELGGLVLAVFGITLLMIGFNKQNKLTEGIKNG